jgi:hypothetical protein
MPLLSFVGDEDFRTAAAWAEAAATRGVYLHPWHNWFLSARIPTMTSMQSCSAPMTPSPR